MCRKYSSYLVCRDCNGTHCLNKSCDGQSMDEKYDPPSKPRRGERKDEEEFKQPLNKSILTPPRTTTRTKPPPKKRWKEKEKTLEAENIVTSIEEKELLETRTGVQPLPIENLGTMLIKMAHTNSTLISNAAKVSYKGKPAILACRHQTDTPSNLWGVDKDGGEFPIQHTGSWEYPFVQQDIAIMYIAKNVKTPLPGKCMKIEEYNPELAYPDKSCSYLTRDPDDQKVKIAPIAVPSVSHGKFYYRVSTMNGSCGSVIIKSENGSHTVIGVHAGTKGVGSTPNFAYMFVSKND